jgi:hypothetical protein
MPRAPARLRSVGDADGATFPVVHAVLHAFLYLLPALALLLALRARRYPGERSLLALIARRRSRRRAAVTVCRYRAVPRATLARGGALLGEALAVRPPPDLLAAFV